MKHALFPFLLPTWASLHFLRKVRKHVHQGHVSKFRLQAGGMRNRKKAHANKDLVMVVRSI